ncbi:Gfo/Idh/MocA family protein [Pedobacter sandarakinus]|uniref:Gfo/Idh/MocA family protein n=1 Tax=Pedobacter sandarakinus TaxID=353156 RepID=UPI0022487402|nr:Gfo/Idh/MocA family oxidoreductase [Pedobacter sandarakinus]MCX2574959.1 Gfo/Idh/MocA family oxidoreductase [Pedobacter sandarakinus]
MKEIKWGIIGCGDVTEVKSGPAFNKVSNSSLVAVMRRDGLKAADYAKRHQVPKWYTDAKELIHDSEVNAIYIATPPLQHEEYTIKALAAGKPVYVEKPMALNSAAAERMVQASQQYNTPLVVAHYRRAQPLFLKIKSLLHVKAIGDVLFVDLKMLQSSKNKLIAASDENWRINPAISGGGFFHDLAPHQIDLMFYYFGDLNDYHGYALNQGKNSQADDLVSGHMHFKNGVLFNGLWSFNVSPHQEIDRCDIYGSKGKISFPMFGHHIELQVGERAEIFDLIPLPHVEQPMIEQVVNFFRGAGKNPCSGNEALKTMKILDGFTGPKII